MTKNNKETAVTRYEEGAGQIQTPPPEKMMVPSGPQAVVKTMEQGFDEEIAKLINQAGTIDLTNKQKEILFAPVTPEDVEIRPDGLIYLPWMEYVSRLRDAFALNWAIIPKGLPKMNPTRDGILWGFYLIIQGKPAGFAVGEQDYHDSNATMTWSDACEGAKSNALMRLCKGLGISLELWRPSFVRAWKEKFAESYKKKKADGSFWKDKNGRDKLFWRKKTRDASEGEGEEEGQAEQKPKPEPKPEPKPAAKPKAKPEPEKPKPQAAEKKKTREPGEDDQPAGDPDMEKAIESIKKKLEGLTIDAKDFKHWLFEGIQQKMKRQFVIINQFGKFSFHVPPEFKKDILYLDKNLDEAVDKYVTHKMKTGKKANGK